MEELIMRPLHAVILAAGMGTRLRPTGRDGPKGALCVACAKHNRESVHRLLRAGIERITLVTGYQSDFYDTVADPCRIRSTRSTNLPVYADSGGSMYSLYLARASNGAFPLLSRTSYMNSGHCRLCFEHPAENLLLLSGKQVPAMKST